jgi:hypothetical protein
MTPVPASDIAAGIVAWLLVVLIVLSLCRAAAIGDLTAQDALRRRKGNR